jgi:hypothetical protein
MPKKRLTDDERDQKLYNEAFETAKDNGIDFSYFELWVIKLKPPKGISIKYKALLLFALTGFFKAKELASEFNYPSEQSLNQDFNKSVGSLVRHKLGIEDKGERFGISSIRSACYKHEKKLFLVYDDRDLVNILNHRYIENSKLEEPSIPAQYLDIDENATN